MLTPAGKKQDIVRFRLLKKGKAITKEKERKEGQSDREGAKAQNILKYCPHIFA